MKCIIVDDEEMATRVIESHVSLVDDLEVVGVFHSAIEAFMEVESMKADLIFLDIQMPKMSGLEMLRSLKNPPLVILTTAHRDYAIEGFDLDVADYLLKPISVSRFLQSIKKVNRLKKQAQEPKEKIEKEHVYLKVNRAYTKLLFEDIYVVEAIKNHVKIITKNGTHISLISLTQFLGKLPLSNFVRVHRSYVVNKSYIHKINNSCIEINNIQVPIGRSFKKEAQALIQNILD